MISVDKIQPRWVRSNYDTYDHSPKYTIYLTNKHKEQLIRKGAKTYMSEEDFLAINIENRGRKCEKWLYECTEQADAYKVDTVPFYIDGDITIDNIKYQIKFQNASLANVKTIKKLKNMKEEA